MEGVSLSGLSPAVGTAEVGHAEILERPRISMASSRGSFPSFSI